MNAKSITLSVALALVVGWPVMMSFAEDTVDFTGRGRMANQHPKDGKENVEIVLLDIEEDQPADVLQGQTYRANMQRTGVFKANGVPAFNEVKWKFKTGGKVRCSPVIVDGVVYVGSLDKNFYAINANDGTVKWKFETQGKIYSSPTIYDGLVYFSSFDGNCYALNITDGSLVWKIKGKKSDNWADDVILDGAPSSVCSPAISYGLIFTPIKGAVQGFDLKTGKPVWESPTACLARGMGSTTISMGKVCHSFGEGRFGGWSIRSGKNVFTKISGGVGFEMRVSTSAAIDGRIYDISHWGNVVCFDLRTCRELWESSCGTTTGEKKKLGRLDERAKFGVRMSSPSVTDKMLAVGLVTGVSGMDITSKAENKEKWFFKTGSRVLASPSIAGNTVYIGSENGIFYALDLDTGKEKWQFKTGGSIISSAHIEGNNVYFGSDDGYVYCLK